MAPEARRTAYRALREFYYELRTTEDSPARTALAVFAGVVIGCLPIYGLHLACCVLVARSLRVSITKAYLAAHINNPFTAPLIVATSVVIGRRVLVAKQLEVEPEGLAHGALNLGREVLVGALVLGVSIGLVAALIALLASRRWGADPVLSSLQRRVSERFLDSGIRHWEFVRGKLRYDPVYFGLIEAGLIAPSGSVVDLGCGRGILLALLAEIDGRNDRLPRSLTGIEVDPRAAFVARSALGGQARLCVLDLAAAPVPAADTIVLLDVLHYLPRGVQDSLLQKVAAALRQDGRVIIREADRDGGWRFQMVRVAERLRAWSRGRFSQPFEYRSAAELAATVAELAVEVETRTMARGTPFANVVIVGTRRQAQVPNAH